jgi:hypothetical protein
MSLYIRLSTNFFSHVKTLRLKARIGNDAFWIPPRLWVYAAEHQPDGNLSKYTPEEIAMLVGWDGDARALLQALLHACFLDDDPLRIHGWDEHNGFHKAFADRASKAAMARWRRKEKTGEEKTGDEMTHALHQALLGHETNTPGIPVNEKQAVEWASMSGVPAEFAKDVFNQCEGVNWIDGARRPITNFRSYVASRFSRQREVSGQPTKQLSVSELRTVIEAKNTLANDIKAKFSVDMAMGNEWKNDAKKEEFFKLKKEIKQLREHLSAMA